MRTTRQLVATVTVATSLAIISSAPAQAQRCTHYEARMVVLDMTTGEVAPTSQRPEDEPNCGPSNLIGTIVGDEFILAPSPYRI